MAPELWMNRDPDPRADQFSFCVTMWEAIYGARPWEVTVDCLLGTEPAKPVDPETIPEALERALRRGLSSQPRARFASMEALVRAIGRRWFPPRGRVARHGPQARWFSLPPGRSGRGFW
jgi:eukaryotic-like serine/threonine-protein kinase